MWFILSILLLIALIIIHELGHFIAARLSKVTVWEFGIWLPPKLLTRYRDARGTEFSLNAIPLGGFVRIKGDSTHTTERQDDDSFLQSPLYKKIIILIGGIAMNILFARWVFTILFAQGTQPLTILPDSLMPTDSYILPSLSFAQQQGIIQGETITWPATITHISTGSRAAQANIPPQATLTHIITSQQTYTLDNQNIGNILAQQHKQQFQIQRTHQDQTNTSTITCDPDCFLGVTLHDESTRELYPIQRPLPQAALLATHEVVAQLKLSFQFLGKIITQLTSGTPDQQQEALQSFGWPIGAVQLGQQMFQAGGRHTFALFAAMISLALALFNLLPIPAVDGGRIISILIQYVTRIPPAKYYRIESYINTCFFLILLVLGILIMYKDIINR